MSWTLKYVDENDEPYPLDEPFSEGGTVPIGGETTTVINITYNYGWYYQMFISPTGGLKALHGLTGNNAKSIIKYAIKQCPDDREHSDYWASVPGNCVKPLKRILSWIEKYPDGLIDIS